MKLKITKPDIISKKDFKRTQLETVFTDKKEQAVAIVNKDHAIVISQDNNSKDKDGTE